MTKYKTFLTLLIALSFGPLKAQDDLTNMKKYWWYHHRLVNDFLLKGDFQGGSIPFNQRAFGVPPGAIAYWGDGSIALSQYVAVLATEFKLLQMQGQPTDSTLEELYLAIKAINRLDEIGEVNSVFPTHTTPTPADINGYFIRDDIPVNFLTNPDHAKLAEGRVTGRSVSNVLSDFNSLNPTDKEMSHDQVWHMFTAFALIRKCLYPGISYNGLELNDKTHNADIWVEAEAIADRMLSRIKNSGWVVTNPNTGVGVERGPYVQELSYGAAEAGCYIKNLNTSLDPGYPVHTCTDYHDVTSLLLAETWMNYGHGIGTFIAFSPEDFKVQTLATIGNSWWNKANPFWPDPVAITEILFDPTNFLHPFSTIIHLITAIAPLPPYNVTAAELAVRSTLRDYQHLPMLHQILHGGPNAVPPSFYINLLNGAPACGPHNYGYPANSSSFEWSTDSRLLYPQRRGERADGTDRIDNFYGEFNGLD